MLIVKVLRLEIKIKGYLGSSNEVSLSNLFTNKFCKIIWFCFQAKKERNVLAHQSQLLMCEVASDERLLQLLNEIENLKRNLEEEQQTFATQIQQLQVICKIEKSSIYKLNEFVVIVLKLKIW